MKVPFFEFRFDPELRVELNAAQKRVIDRGVFISGPELEAFEREVANYLDVDEVIGVGNGYDALFIALKSISLNGPKKVLLQANAYPATINAVINSGNTPVFFDIDLNTNFFSDSVHDFIEGNKIDVILPIYFFGSTSNLLQDKQLNQIIIEDYSQTFGAKSGNQYCGTIGKINAASLYPTKSFGALGDAGIISTDQKELAEFCRQYRNYGEESYSSLNYSGINSRLDEIQAAFLRVMLKFLPQNIEEKRTIAQKYFHHLEGVGDLILPSKNFESDIYHQFTIKTDSREKLLNSLKSAGIETKIHYPSPVFEQKAYQNLDLGQIHQNTLAKWHNRILSLPSFVGITDREIEYVCDSIKKVYL